MLRRALCRSFYLKIPAAQDLYRTAASIVWCSCLGERLVCSMKATDLDLQQENKWLGGVNILRGLPLNNTKYCGNR